MSRDILGALKEADIQVASATFELTGLPPLRIRMQLTHSTNVRTIITVASSS